MARVAELQLHLEQRKDCWLFTATLEGARVAVLRAVPHGADVIMHLDVHAWSRGLYREYLVSFEAIRLFFREEGRGLLMVYSESCDAKMMRFWRLMGFNVFGDVALSGRRVPYAVMEV